MTSSGSGGDGFFGQFIEDYYAECDEHLATARRVLLALETGAAEATPPDPALLRELFRSLHTLKGLAGMVGDTSAEQLAHAVEGALRAGERPGAPLPAPLVDALFAGVDMLGRCVAARRSSAAPPDVAAILAALAPRAPVHQRTRHGAAGPPSPVASPASATPRDEDDEVDGEVWHFEFTPSVALTDRGVGVDLVRARLRALGSILDAKPRMAGGGLVFDFWVSVPAGRVPETAWSADGLRWTAARDERAHAGAEPGGAVPSGGPAPAAAPVPPSAPAPGAGVVRVELSRLDVVMRLVGDLVVSRSRLDDLVRQAGDGGRGAAGVRDELEETSAAMERQLRQLRESVMRIRLVPVGEAFERLRFAARDAIRESGKRVTLVFHGQRTEVDKLVVDRMLEPLLHLVRNAVSHGIESPAEREARGKPAEGTLTLRAAAAGDRITIDVQDDGGGIDRERVAARARALGLLEPGEELTDENLLKVLCAPGFSTRDEADRTSGRGVGMDVVRSTVHALSGELSVSTEAGRGTRFSIALPLTLMIVDALLVDVGGQQMAVPQPALREILQVESAAVVPFENNDVVAYRSGVLPLVRLARLFGLPQERRPSVYVLVVGADSAPMGLVVDRLLGLREIVVHPVTDPLVAVPGIAGATELGDGRVSLILDAVAILRLASDEREERARVARSAPRIGRAAAVPPLPS